MMGTKEGGRELVKNILANAAKVLRRDIPVIVQGPGNIFHPDNSVSAAIGLEERIRLRAIIGLGENTPDFADFLTKHPFFGYAEMMDIEGNCELINDIFTAFSPMSKYISSGSVLK